MMIRFLWFPLVFSVVCLRFLRSRRRRRRRRCAADDVVGFGGKLGNRIFEDASPFQTVEYALGVLDRRRQCRLRLFAQAPRRRSRAHGSDRGGAVFDRSSTDGQTIVAAAPARRLQTDPLSRADQFRL